MGQPTGGRHAVHLARMPGLASQSVEEACRMGQAAGGRRAVGRAMLPETARLSVKPDGWMGQRAGLAREIHGSGRLMGQDAG